MKRNTDVKEYENKLKYLLEYAVINKFQEIYIENIDNIKNIVFFSFADKKLVIEKEKLSENFDISKNIILEEIYRKKLSSNNYVCIWRVAEDTTNILENLFIKVYLFENKNKISLYIKLLNYSIPLLEKILINYKKNENKDYLQKIYNILINSIFKGINVISSNSHNAIKLFLYSVINEINKKTTIKVLSYEDIIEKNIESKNSIVLQKEYNDKILEEVKIINPNIILIEKEIDEEILYIAYKLVSWNKKIFLITSSTETKDFTNKIEQVCNKYGILSTNFNENTLSFITLKYQNKLKIDNILLGDDIFI